MPDQLTRGPRYESRRFFHERTGDPLSAYVVGGYVIEKARRDWDARAFRGSAGNPTKREWWEVRVQAARGQPGCSLGRNPLFAGVSGQDTSSAASLYPLGPARYFVRLRCGHKKLTDYKPLVTSYCPDCKRRRVVEDVDDAN